MILHSRERNDIKNRDEIVCNVNSSWQYQIKKIRDLCKKVEFELHKPRN